MAEDQIAPQPFAVLAFVLTIAALVSAFTLAARRPIWPAVLSGAAALMVAIAQLDFDRTMTDRIVERLTHLQPAALERADPTSFVAAGIGFWAVLGFLIVATALNVGIAIAAARRAPPTTADASEPVPLPAAA